MPRRVQDIVPATHRSIRDIPVERSGPIIPPIQPPPRTKTERFVNLRKIIKDDEEQVETKKPSPRTYRRRTWPFVLVGTICFVAIVGYLASLYFSYATFVLAPKSVPLSINSTYIAKAVSDGVGLTYQVASVKGSAESIVSATDGAKVSIPATGKIIVYNAHSAQPQRLIAGTRFADDTGRVYRLTNSILVPGYTVSSGSSIPGSITTTVAADQPGQSYNIGKADGVSDFKIVAYKGTSKYETMYGRLASDIAGGFVGIKRLSLPIFWLLLLPVYNHGSQNLC